MNKQMDTKQLTLQKLDTDLEKVLKRNTVKEVYVSIQEDIDEARKLVTEAEWEQRYSYRFNTASVEAFQSRVSQTRRMGSPSFHGESCRNSSLMLT